MGLGSTRKKLQTVVDNAEKMYERIKELRTQVMATKETVEDTNGRLDAVELEQAKQSAVLEALADQEGINVEQITDAVEDGHSTATNADAVSTAEQPETPRTDST